MEHYCIMAYDLLKLIITSKMLVTRVSRVKEYYGVIVSNNSLLFLQQFCLYSYFWLIILVIACSFYGQLSKWIFLLFVKLVLVILFLQELEQSKPVILTGDLNCAHQEIDIYDPAVRDSYIKSLISIYFSLQEYYYKNIMLWFSQN